MARMICVLPCLLAVVVRVHGKRARLVPGLIADVRPVATVQSTIPRTASQASGAHVGHAGTLMASSHGNQGYNAKLELTRVGLPSHAAYYNEARTTGMDAPLVRANSVASLEQLAATKTATDRAVEDERGQEGTGKKEANLPTGLPRVREPDARFAPASPAEFVAGRSPPSSWKQPARATSLQSRRATQQQRLQAEKPPLESKVADLSPEELEKRRQKALALWEGLKPDVEDQLKQYSTFRIDKFDEFMRKDPRGKELFQLYTPGTPEYAEFFEKEMGPELLELAKGKLGEGLGQVVGVIVIVGLLVAFCAFFGTNVIQGITSPLTGIAQDFTGIYGF